jgi:hypothetical protein
MSTSQNARPRHATATRRAISHLNSPDCMGRRPRTAPRSRLEGAA